MLDRLVMDGTIALVAMGVLVIECVVMIFLARARPSLRTVPIAVNILSGLCLILALRAALVGSGATMIAVWLGLGGIAHLGDMVMRLRR